MDSKMPAALTVVLAVVAAVCSAGDSPCTGHLPSSRLPPGHFIQGIYYLKLMTSMPPECQNTEGFSVKAVSMFDEVILDGTLLQDGNCSHYHVHCIVNKYTCRINTGPLKRNYTLVAANQTLMAVYTHDRHPALMVFDQTQGKSVDLSPIRSQLESFCGKNATDPESDFYQVKLHYPETALFCPSIID